jgi:hypothetical protein
MIKRCKTGKDARLGKMQDWERCKTGKDVRLEKKQDWKIS